MGHATNSLLHAAKWCIRGQVRHGPLHRRWQIGLLLKRRGKTWKSPLAKTLVSKYGAVDA